jgi:predicted ATPase/transcriptional regulator with XRE-family HTH domain
MDTAELTPSPPVQASFGALLRRYRLAAELSQEALAERAGLSVQALSALENGRRHAPYRHTVTLLARAMGLADAEAAALEAAIVRRRVPGSAQVPMPAMHNPQTMPEHETGGDAVPPVRIAQPSRTNLPVALTSFIGREREQGEVRALLDAARLVTLTGAGGAGKTRLALALAEAVLGEYPDGIWLVELASLADPTLVVQAVAVALGLREEPYRSLLATLIDYLTEKHLLLVLDNCEHLVSACAELAATLLQRSPRVRILATSRETLSVPGETTYRVPSLAVPDLAHLPSMEDLAGYAAVQLFLSRAQSRRPDFTLGVPNARAVAEVCARLDGMPLAIELAAARVSVLPVEGIAARLDDRFQVLTGGPRTALPRHQTLRATLDWSYALLTEAERALLRRLCVFTGGWSLEAAVAVCGMPGDLPGAVLEGLSFLVDKSLVHTTPQADGTPRFGMLETIRQYGRDHLAASGEAADIQRAHALYYLEVAEVAEPELLGREQVHWLTYLELEHDNLRVALRWAHDQQESEIALRLGGALASFWCARGHLREGREWLEKLLLLPAGGDPAGLAARQRTSGAGPLHYDAYEATNMRQTEPQAPPAQRRLDMRARAWVLRGVGFLTLWQADYGQAQSSLEDAVARCREIDGTEDLADALNLLGTTMRFQGKYRRATLLYDESLALYRTLGEQWGIARELMNLGEVALELGDFIRALPLVEESLSLSRELGDTRGVANALMDLGDLAYHRGDYTRAIIMYEECLALSRESGEVIVNAWAQHRFGRLAMAQGAHALATSRHREGLALAWAVGTIYHVVDSLEGVAAAAHGEGQPERAAQLLGAAEAVREARGIPLVPVDRPSHDALLAAVRAALGDGAFATAWAEGRALPLAEAVALALEAKPAP